MNKKSKIIILRGNSGSGKSTAAKLLQNRFGYGTLLISQDMIRREILWVKDGIGTKAISLLIEMVKYGRENCDVVILEGILNADWYRELFEQIKVKFDPWIYAYYYEIPFEETLIRHRTKPNCNDFGEEEMKRWWKEKDYIGIIPEKIITADYSMDKTVDMIFQDIKNEK
ncbi:kinase [Anaerocolumna sp. MB42-C2]|uniref:kinase n=1 Tax=Anaerocolumna sp. MB42-C2 TaxID=3070997 RepID=UPI0027DF0E6F|nr:kinase [Anaerocolumna sp. MB42-C2]WMJ86299.1 kinase [Anaerocolumna sp. MB42-C2]